jgi:dolichol kinase
MDTSRLNDQLTRLMSELRAVVLQFEAIAAGGTTPIALSDRVTSLAEMAEQVSLTIQQHKSRNAERIVDALQRLKGYVNENREALSAAADFRRFKQPLADRYEHLLDAMRTTPRFKKFADTLRTLRPTNYRRNIFHVTMGISAVCIYEWLTVTRGNTVVTLAVVLGAYLFLDGVRRLHPTLNHLIYGILFKPIARPRERYQTPAAVWYVLGLFFAVLIASPTHAQLAALVLGVADPAASIIGKRWGKRKIFRDRSYVGTFAFICVSFLATVCFLSMARDWSHGLILLTATMAAIMGALAELLSSDRLDDNLLIPCFVAGSLTLALGSAAVV